MARKRDKRDLRTTTPETGTIVTKFPVTVAVTNLRQREGREGHRGRRKQSAVRLP